MSNKWLCSCARFLSLHYSSLRIFFSLCFVSSPLSSFLQRSDADAGVQSCHEDYVEFRQAPADGKDPIHPWLPCRPKDIKECKSPPPARPLHLPAFSPPTLARPFHFFQHTQCYPCVRGQTSVMREGGSCVVAVGGVQKDLSHISWKVDCFPGGQDSLEVADSVLWLYAAVSD